MLYKIRTANGVLVEGYSALLLNLFGAGQGSAASLSVWCAISMVIFRAYNQEVKELEFSDPTGTITSKRGGYMQVDDAQIGIMDAHCETPINTAELTGQLQFATERGH